MTGKTNKRNPDSGSASDNLTRPVVAYRLVIHTYIRLFITQVDIKDIMLDISREILRKA